jgi:hypothetical protein
LKALFSSETGLKNRLFPSGEHHLGWDGRDDGGFAVGSGVYLARFAGKGLSQMQKLVLVR